MIDGLWGSVIKDKYLQGLSVQLWIRRGCSRLKGASNMWNGFTSAFQILVEWLAWKVGNGLHVLLGVDPIIGGPSQFKFSWELGVFLRERGFITLHHAIPATFSVSPLQAWISAEQLGLRGTLAKEWLCYL